MATTNLIEIITGEHDRTANRPNEELPRRYGFGKYIYIYKYKNLHPIP